ncbi:hypothetical protein [Nonomuraea rosea]|uniref:hypothetical protein n=1 Tax=Nonomuraea rosea TaxID=638574 RepID=UPI003CD06D81
MSGDGGQGVGDLLAVGAGVLYRAAPVVPGMPARYSMPDICSAAAWATRPCRGCPAWAVTSTAPSLAAAPPRRAGRRGQGGQVRRVRQHRLAFPVAASRRGVVELAFGEHPQPAGPGVFADHRGDVVGVQIAAAAGERQQLGERGDQVAARTGLSGLPQFDQVRVGGGGGGRAVQVKVQAAVVGAAGLLVGGGDGRGQVVGTDLVEAGHELHRGGGSGQLVASLARLRR